MGRAAKDGAGAVFHQHEVSDPDRQLDLGPDRVLDGDTKIDALLLGPFSIAASVVSIFRVSAMNAASSSLSSANSREIGCSGEIAMKLAPRNVSGRVE